MGRALLPLACVILCCASANAVQQSVQSKTAVPAEQNSSGKSVQPQRTSPSQSIPSYNRRLQELAAARSTGITAGTDYWIGADDLLEISIYGAPDLGGTLRVSRQGSISMPLIGDVQAAGMTPRGLEARIEELLRRNYMNHPHATVFVKEIESHPVAVIGAVAKPGIYQLRGPEPLANVLSLAQGLADDAGETAIVTRRAYTGTSRGDESGAAAVPRKSALGSNAASGAEQREAADGKPSASRNASVSVNLQELLSSKEQRYNVTVFPGDTVKVPRAGVVYVIGEVHKPGGFLIRRNESISVLQALALAEGLTSTSAAKSARIIRTDPSDGARREIPINLKKILSGRARDPQLQAKDIVFVPNSASKTAFVRGTEAAISIAAGVIVYRR